MQTEFSKYCFLVFGTLLSSGLIPNSAGEDDCKTIMGNLVKSQIDLVKTCLSEMSFKDPKEKSKKMTCVIICALKKAGFIDETGNADAVASIAFMENTLPPEIRNRMMDLMMNCHEHLGTIDPSDESCKSYEPMIKCAQSKLNQVCEA